MLEQNTRSFSRYLFGQAMEVDADTQAEFGSRESAQWQTLLVKLF